MNLTLIYPLTYKIVKTNYNQALKEIYSAPIGSDKIFKYNYKIEDENIFCDLLSCGDKAPLKQEEKDVIEKGLPPLHRSEEVPFLKSGKYAFSQLPPAECEQELPLLIFGECEQNNGDVFIRLFKENTIEVIMQFFFPKEE